MRHLLASLSMLCLFLPACRPDEAHVDPEPITTLRGQWSEPVDGLSCRIALTKDTLHVGTLSIFHIELKNTSDAPIDLVQPSYTTGQRGQILLTHDGKTYDERNFSRPSDTSYPPPATARQDRPRPDTPSHPRYTHQRSRS